MKPLIYACEDDANIAFILQKTLENANYRIQTASSYQELIRLLETEVCDVLLLDIMLPNKSGLDILVELRNKEAFASMIIMIVSAKGSEQDKVLGLDLGADDYLTKPFSILELTSRIQAHLRRKTAPKETLEMGNVILDKVSRTLYINQEEVVLTYKEFALLEYLLSHPKKAIKREELLQAVWGFDFLGESRTLDMHITAIRKKLLQHEASVYIETIRSIGYRLMV